VGRDDIIKLAREAGLYVGRNISGVQLVGSSYEEGGLLVHLAVEELERFAALVAAAEREACAKVCDVLAVHPEYASDITKVAAQAIRARGNT
jgi:hypothetical protein